MKYLIKPSRFNVNDHYDSNNPKTFTKYICFWKINDVYSEIYILMSVLIIISHPFILFFFIIFIPLSCKDPSHVHVPKQAHKIPKLKYIDRVWKLKTVHSYVQPLLYT